MSDFTESDILHVAMIMKMMVMMMRMEDGGEKENNENTKHTQHFMFCIIYFQKNTVTSSCRLHADVIS